MKKIFPLLLAALFLQLGSACSALFSSALDKQLLVQPGMTKEELTQRCGAPDYRRFAPHSEEWEYVLTRTEKHVVRMKVHFEGGRVVAMNTFEDAIYQPRPSEVETK